MRVKIGDTWYDCADQPLAVQFTENELDAILTTDWSGSSRSFGAGYLGEPEEGGDDPLLTWMRDGRDK